MIEVIEGLPHNVLGIVATGKVTKWDCSEILIPAVEKAREWHHKLRLYYEIRSRYPGAAWEDLQLGIGQHPLWERIAIVTDVAWIKHTVQALRLLIPGEIRVFTTIQTPEGLAWIADMKWRKRHSAPVLVVDSLGSGGSRAFLPARQFLHQAP
jgi:SpoIIAA-like